MSGRIVGSLVGLVFGLIYLVVNSPRLPGPLPLLVMLIAVAAAVAFVTLYLRNRPLLMDIRSGESAAPFGGRFALVTVLEVVAIFGGIFVLNTVFHRPDAGVAWVTTVVGAHFFPLGRLSGMPLFTTLAWILTPLGLLGLVLAFTGMPAWWVDLTAGVLPGLVMLWSALRGLSTGAHAEQRRMQAA